MPESPDYTEAGEIYRKSLEQALANIDKVNEDLLRQQKKAIEDQFAAMELRSQIERDAHRISEDYILKHRNEYIESLRHELLLDIVKKLILAEIPSVILKRALQLSPEILTDIWMDIGFEKLDEHHIAHVGYDIQSKTGYLVFYREDLSIRFPLAFGEGLIKFVIGIPTHEHWENQTGTHLEERKVILDFVGSRAHRDLAQGHHLRYTDDAIYVEAQ